MTAYSNWFSHLSWQGMDFTLRGFYAHLLLLSQSTQGCLPAPLEQWSHYLGLPGLSLTDAQAPSEHGGTTTDPLLAFAVHQASVAYFWHHRWKPQLEKIWRPLQPHEQARDPHHAQGWLTCDLAQQLAWSSPASQVALPGLMDLSMNPYEPFDSSFEPDLNIVKKDPTPLKLSLSQAFKDGHIHPNAFKSLRTPEGWFDLSKIQPKWKPTLNKAEQIWLWEKGIELLKRPNSSDTTLRATLATLIKTYGEPMVASAIGEMAIKSVPPAEPISYLRHLLKTKQHGTAQTAQARERRADVAL